jgi:putative Mn2+ efflux pump MntP
LLTTANLYGQEFARCFMDTLTLLGTAVALGMDAFAVAICVAASLAALTARHVFRLSWHFGVFQSLMTICGWVGGAALSKFMGGANYWIAFGILALLGLNMIRESLQPECRIEDHDPTRGWSLIGFSVATSIDALAVGVSLSLIGLSIWVPAAVIGVAAIFMTYVGMKIGRQVGMHLGQWAERIGGIVLIAIGGKVLLDYLTR